MRTVAAWLALSAASIAQDTPHPTANACSQALHAAWLREVVDGDLAGAAREYAKIAANGDPLNVQRWVAIARLAELRRLGLPAPDIHAQNAPALVQAALDATRAPLANVAELLDRAAQSPEQLQTFTGESSRLPDLRPATPVALAWMRERLQNRGPGAGRGGRQPGGNPRNSRSYAADILFCELHGRTEQADSLRMVCFGDWKAPTIPNDIASALVKVRLHLDAWLAERDVTTGQQDLLRDLRDAIDKRAAADPAAALAFVARLPIYADRLLGNPQGTPSSR